MSKTSAMMSYTYLIIFYYIFTCFKRFYYTPENIFEFIIICHIIPFKESTFLLYWQSVIFYFKLIYDI